MAPSLRRRGAIIMLIERQYDCDIKGIIRIQNLIIIYGEMGYEKNLIMGIKKESD